MSALVLPRRTLTLTAQEQAALEQTLRRDPRPYLRERASALLQIAAGHSPHWVALHGLLRVRQPDTVYRWLRAYEAVRSLQPRPPCRRAFSP